MRSMVHNRVICIILTITMLFLGICCVNAQTDSLISNPSTGMCTDFIKEVRGNLNAHIYLEKDSIYLFEESVLAGQTSRNVLNIRINQILISVILSIISYLLTASFYVFFMHVDANNNQYRHRTLKYIHHKDGKKA